MGKLKNGNQTTNQIPIVIDVPNNPYETTIDHGWPDQNLRLPQPRPVASAAHSARSGALWRSADGIFGWFQGRTIGETMGKP